MMLFSALCDLYLDAHASGKKTAAGDCWMVEKYIRPEFKNRQVESLNFNDMHGLHRKLKSAPYQANRVLSLLSTMFNLAPLWDIDLPRGNPCRFVKRYPEKKRRRYLKDEEARAMLAGIETRFDRFPLECALLLLELYTGARPRELKTATWPMLDGDRLEHDDTKTGQRTIYLTPQALAVISRLPRPRKWIIGPDISARYVWASVIKETGIKNLRMYDLRHSFASFGLGVGLSMGQLQELMGHSSPVTTMRYAHLEQARGSMAADAIAQRMKGIGL